MFNQDAKKNMYSGILYQICTLIVGFVMRKYIIDYLGVYNLGVIGVFENAMSMLNLLDFGIGSACMYYLYKAFAKNDKEQMASVYVFFVKSFRKVALAVAVIGAVILLNIRLIIDIENNESFLQLVFGLFLLKSVLNCFVICPRTCLQCDGKRYFGTIADTVSMIVFAFVKVYFLKLTGNLVIYIILLTVEMLASAVYIYYCFRREYKDVDFRGSDANSEIQEGIKKYSRSLAISNINYFIYSSTDNIVLSKICGTVVVGFMSNYYMIVNAIKGFVNQIISSIEANLIRNYNTDSVNKKDQYNLSMLFCFCVSSFCCICLYNLTDDFIGLIFGSDYVMDKNIILFMTIALLINILRSPSQMLVISKKMVSKEIPFTMAMMVANVLLSIIFAFRIGPAGVLLGTIISESILLIGDELLAFRCEIGLGRDTMLKKAIYLIIIVLEYLISSLLTPAAGNLYGLIANFVICTIVFFCSSLVFAKTKEFKDLMRFILNIKNY